MRIQLLCDSYLPSTTSCAKLIHDLAMEFCRRGHHVRVAAPDATLASNYQITREGRLSVVGIKTKPLKQVSKIVRCLREAQLARLMWKRGKPFFLSHASDYVVFYSPSIFLAPLAAKLKARWRCPAYLILRDLFPQWAVDAGLLRPAGPAYRFLRYHELKQYRTADVVGVQSPANLQYFHDQALRKCPRLEVLYNWGSTETPQSTTKYRDRWGLNDKVVFFFGGNVGIGQDIDNVLRLADNLRDDPTVHFLLVGAGDRMDYLRAQVAARKLPNVSAKPPMAQHDYLAMLGEFDVGLISLDRRLGTHNYPGKMLGYMSRAMPMLASINPGNDLKQLLEQHNAGFVCTNGDDAAFVEYAKRLAQDKALRQRLGSNGRALLERHFSVHRAADQILMHVGAEAISQQRQAA